MAVLLIKFNCSIHSFLTDTVFFFGLWQSYEILKNAMVWKLALLPSSGKETLNLVDPLDRAIVSHWVQHQHSACSDM
jgi:hypothetical protein